MYNLFTVTEQGNLYLSCKVREDALIHVCISISWIIVCVKLCIYTRVHVNVCILG